MPSSYSGCNVCPSSAHARQLAGPVGSAWYPHELHDGWHVQSGSRRPPTSAKQLGGGEPDVRVVGPVLEELLKTGEQMGVHACWFPRQHGQLKLNRQVFSVLCSGI